MPDVTFDHRLGLSVGGLELGAAVDAGGETVDSCIVWLPRHDLCLISNLLGPAVPALPPT